MPSPIQGDDKVSMVVKIYEEATAQALEDVIKVDLDALEAFPANSVGVLDIGYQVTAINSSPNPDNVVMSYSANVTLIIFGAPWPPNP